MNLIETEGKKFVKETIKFKLDKEQQIYVLIHNLNMRQYSWPVIVYHWAKETQMFSPESLCAYINSKAHMTGHLAFTEEQWDEMDKLKLS